MSSPGALPYQLARPFSPFRRWLHRRVFALVSYGGSPIHELWCQLHSTRTPLFFIPWKVLSKVPIELFVLAMNSARVYTLFLAAPLLTNLSFNRGPPFCSAPVLTRTVFDFLPGFFSPYMTLKLPLPPRRCCGRVAGYCAVLFQVPCQPRCMSRCHLTV